MADLTAEYTWSCDYAAAASALRAPAMELRSRLERMAALMAAAPSLEPSSNELLAPAVEGVKTLIEVTQSAINLADMGDAMAKDLADATNVPPFIKKH